MVTMASILTHHKQRLKTIMKTNFFDYISSKVLSQLGKDKELYFITSFSKNPNSVKCNYKIYNKELLAIIGCFE